MEPQIIFSSIREMLAPQALSALLGMQVDSVRTAPFEVAHRSANELHQVLVWSDAGRTRLILKEFRPERDWVMCLTHDSRTRETMLFEHGVYARMPPEIVVPVIAVARNGETWANLMRDVSDELVPPRQVVSPETGRVMIEALAALHAHFWNDGALENPDLGLSSLEDFLTILAPARVEQEIDAGRTDPVLEMATRGWRQFWQEAPRDVREIVHAIQRKPGGLMEELGDLPQTLVHADYKSANLGITRDARTVILDWQDATRGAGVLDLGYFLALNARWLPFDKEEAIEIYAKALATGGHAVSMREIKVGLFAGGALRLLWLMALDQQNELDWWYDLIRSFDSQSPG